MLGTIWKDVRTTEPLREGKYTLYFADNTQKKAYWIAKSWKLSRESKETLDIKNIIFWTNR